MKRILVLTGIVAAGASQGWPQAKIDAVGNAAWFEKGLPAGGSLATMFLSGFTRTMPGTYLAASPLPFQLAGFSVNINLNLAPILAVIVTPSAIDERAD